ncbi:trypsin-like cysteine/serine peptidase domain-containing protein [Lipomyces chichibuensis]|uniref:trypsin-like cysteine/serine peptidase domain-containing protein n=1 Tax=Lipomyces chichibuensis TaxID=1546026 RepID=UPI0033433BFB
MRIGSNMNSRDWRFSFTTAALKVVVNEGKGEKESVAAVSAVYITKDDDVEPGLVFTISSALASNIVVSNSGCSFYMATRQSIGAEKITWTPVDIATTLNLFTLGSFIDEFTINSGSMQFHPRSTELASPAIIVILIPRRRLAADRQFIFMKPSVGSALTIEGAPFVVDSPAMFLGFKTTGTVSYVQEPKGSGAIGTSGMILSDVRYLEGMEGSAVLGPSGRSIGILAGSLRKSNGEGELSVICPWTMIVSDIARQFIPEHRTTCAAIRWPRFRIEDASALATLMSEALNVAAPKDDTCMKSIVCIYVHDRARRRRSWGSGIVISKNMVVTNRHVLKSDAGSVTIVFPESNTSRQVRQILNPIPNMDIVYLVFDTPHGDALPATIASGDELVAQMTQITSVGFGLFPPQSLSAKPIMPLVSNGTISQVVKLPLLPHSKGPEVALFSVSAGCWNGSSGGGIFTRTPDRLLLGMITSNGRVDATGTIYPQLGFIIPSNMILLGWEAIKQGGEVHLSEAVVRLWRMQKTHEDVHENIEWSGGVKVKL